MATQEAIVEHMDLSTRRIRGLTKKGILSPSEGHGGFRVDACRLTYVRYLRGVSTSEH